VTPRFTFFGRPVDEETLAKFPDQMVLKEIRDGALIVRRRTAQFVPVPRKVTP
jgi:hypothetical protein